jgi:hypothetical protein
MKADRALGLIWQTNQREQLLGDDRKLVLVVGDLSWNFDIDDRPRLITVLPSGQVLSVDFSMQPAVLSAVINPFANLGADHCWFNYKLDQTFFASIENTSKIASAKVRTAIEDLISALTPVARKLVTANQEALKMAEREYREGLKVSDQQRKLERAAALRRADEEK